MHQNKFLTNQQILTQKGPVRIENSLGEWNSTRAKQKGHDLGYDADVNSLTERPLAIHGHVPANDRKQGVIVWLTESTTALIVLVCSG